MSEDSWIIELLKKEAEEKEIEYKRIGIKAFLKKKRSGPISRGLNKEFLTRIIKDTDAHNDALIRKEMYQAKKRLQELYRCNSSHDRVIKENKEVGKSITKGRKKCFKVNLSDNNDSEKKNQQEKKFLSNKEKSPSIGPEYPLISREGNDDGFYSSGKSMLDTHFDPNYNPRLDVAISSNENNDLDKEFETMGNSPLWKKLVSRNLLQTDFSQKIISEMKHEESFPVYSKGLREWDRGKVVWEDGSIGLEAVGWPKT
ncbi:hypothetical protein PNEG_02285 [Pneumocystis murina B123]|uniref:Uncharacterized protein n=1 Tax=Pneumocystis murina (strain B123) TaxID=1069680 RepID=M7P655_PNEMU|nr:hypothetical protein PNEG_02285 [Pneumocystis murina B123]EMR09330.1 hypothetical protein PNEG_02285 [Pneumocystis murina B123]